MATSNRGATRTASIPITRARQELCPLVDGISRAPGGKLAITVGEEVAAYLVSPTKLAELEEKARLAAGPRPTMRGSAEFLGDPADLDAAIEEASREAVAFTLADFDEQNRGG